MSNLFHCITAANQHISKLFGEMKNEPTLRNEKTLMLVAHALPRGIPIGYPHGKQFNTSGETIDQLPTPLSQKRRFLVRKSTVQTSLEIAVNSLIDTSYFFLIFLLCTVRIRAFFEPSPSRIGKVVQKIIFRASFFKKKNVLCLTNPK